MVLSCVVVFITTYALILPAITLEQDEAEKQGGIDVPAQSDSSAGKGYEITADFDKAGLPEDLELAAEEITGSDQDYDALYQDALQAVQEDSGNKTSDLAFAKFYDISLYSDGERIEPDGPVDVTISYDKAPKASDADKVRIVHFALDEETGEVVPEVLDSKRVEAEVKGGKLTETTFEATSFSIYAIVYTVDFEYDVDGKKYTYSIEGGSKINLADLLLQLQVIMDDPDTEADEVQLFLDEIDKVEFSSPKLVRVEQEDDGWTLTSLKPFDSTETLTVTMKNGDVFTVKVTDAQEVPDVQDATIDPNKSYLICYEANGTYYLLKNDGSVESSHTPADFENLNSTYCWSFNYVFEEKHVEETLDYIYYLIRPIDNKAKTIALNEEGQALVQRGNNNVAVIPAENGGFNLIGYNEVKLNFENGAFSAKEFPEGENGITVHIYEMDSLPTYSYTVRSAHEDRGTVAVSGGTAKTETLADESVIHYYEAESNSDKMNAGTITATAVNHQDGNGDNKWVFDHWTQDGIALDRDDYPATIDASTLPIPFNGSNLVAYFKQNSAYDVPDNEKDPTSVEDMEGWLNDLTTNHVPLDEEATTKTAEVYDYENRIYRVDIESKSNFKTFKGDVDMAFCMDVSNSMYFPSKLDVHTTLPIYQINDSWQNKQWLDTNRGWSNPYYLIADESNTATVFKIYYQDGNWKAQDASRETETDKSFIIGQYFETNWAGGSTHPFNAGDNDDSTYTIYNAGDNGRNRFYYLNEALKSATTDLTIIKNTLEVAGDESPDVRVAYNTFNKELGNQRQDFQTVYPITGIDLSNSHGGGTRPDQAFINAQAFNWQGDDKYVILITDGAPQGGRDDGVGSDFNAISAYVRQQAQILKDYGGIKLITIGLSMDKVPHGKKLLYDLADTDKDGEKMFFMAESASDLPNILRQVTKTIMDDAIVLADVTDTVGEAFYPVDKNTGLQLNPGDMIDIEGRLTTDPEQAAGVIQEDGMTIKWMNQAIDAAIGWHGTIYVKAKEDLLGGNGLKTNGDAGIEAQKYRMGDKEYTFDDSLLGDKLKSLEIEFNSPRVNVNELSFPSESTEWTVYLGTEVDPNAQLKQMYEDILVTEVVNKDGSLSYPLQANSISDNRKVDESGTAQTFQLAGLVLELIKEDTTLSARYIKNDELDWDAFLKDIQQSDGITVPYHPYGIEGDDSNIVIKLTKEILTGEEDDLVGESPHDTTVVNNGNTPAEKYVLTVQYNPDYDHVLPAGQGGHGTYDFNTGSHGAMYQGHAAGRETSTNTHVVNVYKKTIDILKTDENDTALQGATFKLYRKDNDHGSAIEGLSGKYTEVATATSGADGIARLDSSDEDILVGGAAYYLIETTSPPGYAKVDTVWTVEVQADKSGAYTNLDGEVIHTKKYPFNWDQGARIVVDGQPVTVIKKGEGENQTVTVNDGSFVSNGDAISYRYPVENRTANINLSINKTWEDADITPDSISFKLYRVSEKGHLWTNGRVVPCTCTEDGVREYTCSVCEKTETYVIDKTGHTPAAAHRENEIEPTCASSGSYDMVVRCKVCDAVISSEHVDVPATEHTWVNQQVATSDPEHYCYDTVDVCSVCGEVNEEEREHHDHDWGDWETTTPAQPGVAGVETRVCNHDPSHTQTRAIDPLPFPEHRVTLVFRCIGNGNGGGSIYQTTWLADRTGTGVGDMTIQWDWNQYTTEQPFDIDGMYNGEYETHSWSPDGVQYQNDGSNRGGRETLTIHNITSDITLYITIRNNRYDGTNNNLIYQPTFSGPPNGSAALNASAKTSSKASAKLLSKGGAAKAGDTDTGGSRAAGPSMTAEELAAFLEELKTKDEATCAETDGAVHTYKEEVDSYTITPDGSGNWTLPLNDLPKYNEYGNEYKYYVQETSSTYGYEVTYAGQSEGLHNGDTATINNKKLYGSLEITKTVKVSGGPAEQEGFPSGTYTYPVLVTTSIGGTTYYVQDVNGTLGTAPPETPLAVTAGELDAKGPTLTINHLPYGVYTVTEIQPGSVEITGYSFAVEDIGPGGEVHFQSIVSGDATVEETAGEVDLVNYYIKGASWTPEVDKWLNGTPYSGNAEGYSGYTFTLTEPDGQSTIKTPPAPGQQPPANNHSETVTTGEDGKAVFHKIDYKHPDIGGAASKDFYYTITEERPAAAQDDPYIAEDIKYDTKTIYVVVTVTRQGGRMEAHANYYSDADHTQLLTAVVFNNTELASLSVTKTVTGDYTPTADDKFPITIKKGEQFLNSDGELVDTDPKLTIGHNETLTFAQIPVGTYAVTEGDADRAGYSLTTTYTARVGDREAETHSITLEKGDAGTVDIANAYHKVEVTIVKIDEATRNDAEQARLPGAKFRLCKYTVPEGSNLGSYTVYPDEDNCEKTTDSDGTLTFTGLTDGRYRITETKEPTGYVSQEELEIYFSVVDGVIGWTDADGATINSQDLVSYSPADTTFTVGNVSGAALPNAGGPGTTWIYLIGSLLLLGCGIALVTRRRMRI